MLCLDMHREGMTTAALSVAIFLPLSHGDISSNNITQRFSKIPLDFLFDGRSVVLSFILQLSYLRLCIPAYSIHLTRFGTQFSSGCENV
jgi:hypothetical protein